VKVPRCIGNDVVDLGDRPQVTPRHRARFIQRVCSEAEQALLAREGASDRLLFSLFAAKEAAYKVVCKLGPAPVFAHRKFVVSDDLTSVTYAGWTLQLDLDVDGERVHAVASTFFPAPKGTVARLLPGADESVAARTLLKGVVGRTFGCAAARLEVVRAPDPARWDGLGPPKVLLGGAPLPLDVTLSHDGGFVACAIEG
jgi:phosphopantetheinyl transferase (holo-ACP synthase)